MEDRSIAASAFAGIFVLAMLVAWDAVEIKSKPWRLLACYAIMVIEIAVGAALMFLVQR
jgi:hypothetical protein